MSLFDDQNKTEVTKQITAATCFWLDERGCKPVETEVSVASGWVADIASVVCPSNTELQELRLIRRAPKWSKRVEREAWEAEVTAIACMMTVIVEVKTSRGDFVGDQKWECAAAGRFELDCCAVWPDCGIGKATRLGHPRIQRRTELYDQALRPQIRMTTAEQQRNLIHAVACRRDNQTRYEHINRIRKEYREKRTSNASL